MGDLFVSEQFEVCLLTFEGVGCVEQLGVEQQSQPVLTVLNHHLGAY